METNMAISFTGIDDTSDLENIISSLFSGGISLVSGSPLYIGANGQGSTFSDGSSATGFTNGLLLTSGSGILPSTNGSTEFSTQRGSSGDADLDAASATISAGSTFDANTLQFRIFVSDPSIQSVTINFAFGSDEFPEFSSNFSDVGAILVNGQNVAYFSNGKPLAVINENLEAGAFIDNTSGSVAIEYDGLSRPLSVVVPVNQGENTIKFGVADTNDISLDSGLFIGSVVAGDAGGGGSITQPPIAGDDVASTSAATAVTINVAANDSDPDGMIASYALGTGAANGAAVLNADNTFTYTPNAGFTGIDSFSYTVTDNAGATDTATVQVTVDPAGGTQQDSLSLHVAGDSFEGNAQFIVLVDGQQVGGIQTAIAEFSPGSGQFQDVTLQGDFGPNPQNVTVQFINDAYNGSSSADRNLYVDKLVFNGQTYEGEHAFNPTGVNTSQPADAAALFFQDAPLVFKLENTLSLSVAEDQYQGDAQFIVLVDGQQIGGVQTATTAFSAGSGQFQDISITGHFGSDPSQVEVRFVNDVYGGSNNTDRNLYVNKLMLEDGRVFEGEAATNVTGVGTNQPNDAAALYFDQAALIFQTQSGLMV